MHTSFFVSTPLFSVKSLYCIFFEVNTQYGYSIGNGTNGSNCNENKSIHIKYGLLVGTGGEPNIPPNIQPNTYKKFVNNNDNDDVYMVLVIKILIII